MKYFLLTTNNEELETDRRLSTKKWPFFYNTKNVNNMKKSDKAIIYQGGLGNQKFVADVEISSVVNTDKVKNILFSEVNVWKKPVAIKSIYENLHIIKRPEYFGVYLAGGIKNISSLDFNTIITAKK